MGVDPAKTELVLFTRTHRIPELVLPELNGFNLKISESAKYLRIILDRKLLWNLNSADRINKETIELFACKKAIGKRWGFNPKIIYLIYTAIVKPTPLYGGLVWRTAINKVTIQTKFQRVERSALLCINGVMRTTPNDALNTIFHLPAGLSIKRNTYNICT